MTPISQVCLLPLPHPHLEQMGSLYTVNGELGTLMIRVQPPDMATVLGVSRQGGVNDCPVLLATHHCSLRML